MTDKDDQRSVGAAQLRRRLLGDAMADDIASNIDGFNAPFQAFATRHVFGGTWLNGVLSERELAMVNVGMLAGLGRFEEMGVYVAVAHRLGVTLPELQELLMHITVYSGTPVGRQAFRAARQALVGAGVDLSGLEAGASVAITR